MRFGYSQEVHERFPALVTGALAVDGITADAAVGPRVAEHLATARSLLAAAGTEAALPAVQAWRRAFAALGLEPTRYRCASEALLRRLRRDGHLPQLHPVVDLCNAVSAAYAVPVAVFDLDHVDGDLQVRPAQGTELFVAFGGQEEHPRAGEVVHVDSGQRAHSRRWTSRQSGASAVGPSTQRVLVVAEALHEGARGDVSALMGTLTRQIEALWGSAPSSAVLTVAEPQFTVAG